jgi:predicted molibdopterin-dependent oxidoreductase YjgC
LANATKKIVIDGRPFEAEEGTTLLQAARAYGIKIPYLCFHPALRPIGACKLCAVEVKSSSGSPVIRLACVLRVRDGLEVKTESDLVTKARTRAMKNLVAMAPQSRRLLALAKEWGIDVGPPPDGCIRCRLCIRVCKDVVGAGALKMEERDGTPFVVPVEGLCIGCGTCTNICPTSVIQLQDENGTRTISIRDEIIGIHHLERCDGCGKFYASQKFLAQVEKRITERHPDVKEHHLYCSTCAKLFSDRTKSFARLRKQ